MTMQRPPRDCGPVSQDGTASPAHRMSNPLFEQQQPLPSRSSAGLKSAVSEDGGSHHEEDVPAPHTDGNPGAHGVTRASPMPGQPVLAPPPSECSITSKPSLHPTVRVEVTSPSQGSITSKISEDPRTPSALPALPYPMQAGSPKKAVRLASNNGLQDTSHISAMPVPALSSLPSSFSRPPTAPQRSVSLHVMSEGRGRHACRSPSSAHGHTHQEHVPRTGSLKSMPSMSFVQSWHEHSPLSKAGSNAYTFRPSGTFKLRLDNGEDVEMEADNILPRQDEAEDEDAPVDKEMRARRVKLLSFAQPHMRTFHLAWITLALAFLGAYAAAALKPVIRGSLDLNSADVNHADIAQVVGVVISRLLIMGSLEKVGPRMCTAITMMLITVPICCSSLVVSSGGFIAVRLLSGLGTAMFAIAAHWTASMFSPSCVGAASAYVMGWGSSGAGIGILVLPAIYKGLATSTSAYEAWQWTLIIPGALCMCSGIVVLLLGQDKPTGSLRALQKQGSMSKQPVSTSTLLRVGLSNYRTWVMGIVFALTAGSELAVSNILSTYLYDQFHVPLETAGGLAALFNLMNIFSCPFGGMFSDKAAAFFGVRGRLWAYFFMQAIAGVFLLVMGLSYDSLGTTTAMLILVGFTMTMACGGGYPLTHFISYRGAGVVSSLVTACGGIGGVILQSVFYGKLFQEHHEGLLWNGVAMLASSFLLFFMWWPCWGSMLTPGDGKSSEMDYFIQEFSLEEINERRHAGAERFSEETALAEQAKKFQGAMLPSAQELMKMPNPFGGDGTV